MSSTNLFDSIAHVFNRIWYFSDDYKDFVIQHIIDNLSLSEDDMLADIGGETSVLVEKADLKKDTGSNPYPRYVL